MTPEELEKRIAQLRARPLKLLCRTQGGKIQVMTVRECVETRSRFIHIVADDIDRLLEDEMPNIERGTDRRKEKTVNMIITDIEGGDHE